MIEKSCKLNEKEIIARLKDDKTKEAAFSAIVRAYGEQLYWQIRHMVLSHDDANDVLQNTFLKAWAHIDSFRGEAQISTWLHRIAINETLTFMNKRQNTLPIDTPEGEVAYTLESDTFFNGDHADALLQEAISQLPEKQRLVFNMKYFREMKYEEISQILDTSIGALKASYHLAVKKIEKYFNDKD